MPKALSLKKAGQGAVQKNQKSITQFFSQKQQKSPNKCGLSQTENYDKNSAKRKRLSPIQSQNADRPDEPRSTNSTNILHSTGLNTKKKIKLDHKSPLKITAHETDKTTPKKENSNTTSLSPRKCSNNIKNSKGDGKNTKENDDISRSKNSNKDDVVEVNKLASTFEQNDKLNKVKSLINGNIVNKVVKTPRKVLEFHDCVQNGIIKNKKSVTAQNTPEKDHLTIPISMLKTPDKQHLNQDELSPSKSGSTMKSMDIVLDMVHSPSFSQQFGDDFELEDVVEGPEDLDLLTIQRCEITSIVRHATRLELKLQNTKSNKGTCFVEGTWLDTPLTTGETISVLATRDSSNQFCVSNTSGLLTLRPDHLVSSTSVVGGVFCKRKAVLQERWRGLDSANTAMTMGILIHNLVQKALTLNIFEITPLREEAENLIKESIQMLYDAGLSEDEARVNMHSYIAPLADFMQHYVAKPPVGKPSPKNQWMGQIDKVLDIEENLCSPQLGLKGKIDATLQVTIHERHGRQRATIPLELKSGKASASAEHRGQLILYGMMLSLQRGEDPTTALQRGLLLYLKDRTDLREVSCGYPERRDLVMLRNQLVQYLAAGPEDIDPEQLTDIEDASCLLQQKLPEPVHHENACSKCPYLTVCSLHLWHTNGPSVSESHPLSKLQGQALGHLSPEQIKYFLHWTALLKMEEKVQKTASPLHALWTDSVEKRSKRGTCAANLKLKSVEQSGDRYLHKFDRTLREIDMLQDNTVNKGPQVSEFSIVSLDNRPWIAAGVVTEAKEKCIAIILERDLSRRSNRDTLFHIDTYESYATTIQNLTNLGVLLEDSDRADRLRKLIIEKSPPQFEKKLPREVGRLGTRLMRSLNIQQQRAVLKAIAASHYALLQGLPGTGKTQTISVLIQMLVGLNLKVLVTAHTHSAVDTVLSRLPESLRVMRLGSSSRVASNLVHRCEQQLTCSCETPKQLQDLYDSMEVVGVTCLGASHPLLTRTMFDVCIVDEATQVLQCTVLRPLFAAKRFVLVGDPEQLPPVVRSRAARRLGMEESLFHRLMHSEATSTLQLQYRMNQALANIANKVAYDDRLKCADEKIAQARMDINVKKLSVSEDWILKVCSTEPDFAALFLDMPSMETVKDKNNTTCINLHEACVVMAMVNTLVQGDVNPSQIGIIAPYRDQVSLLRKSFLKHGIDCSTVDQFQGRDKSVIIYSCTKTDEKYEKLVKEGEILNDQRRLAVSVTRAKHKLLVVGNSRALHRYTPFQRLIEACNVVLLEEEVVRSVVSNYKKEFV